MVTSDVVANILKLSALRSLSAEAKKIASYGDGTEITAERTFTAAHSIVTSVIRFCSIIWQYGHTMDAPACANADWRAPIDVSTETVIGWRRLPLWPACIGERGDREET